jgi:hypothetical protein
MTATLFARCSDSPAVRLGEQFYCTIGVNGLNGQRDGRLASAYALCVDRSPSMLQPAYPGGPERWILARDGARAALARLDDQVLVSLIPYSSQARTCWSGTAGDAKRRLDEVVALIEPPYDGMTNFEVALATAKNELGSVSVPGRRILLFTDGHATEGKGANDPNDLVPFRSLLADSGIFIDALGIGKETRTDLLELLVGNTGQLDYVAETEDDAKRLADKVLAALTAWDSTVGTLWLRVRVWPAFDVLEAWHWGPKGTRLKVVRKGEKGTDLEENLGAIGSDDRQQAALLLTLRAPRQAEFEVPLLTAAGDIRTGSDSTELLAVDGETFANLFIAVNERGGQRDPLMEEVRNACWLRERWMEKADQAKDRNERIKIYEDAIAEAKGLGNPDGIITSFQDTLDRLRAGQDPADVANVARSGSSQRKTLPRDLLRQDRQTPSEGAPKPF